MATPDYTPNIPYGYCHCGCGQKTKIATKSHTRNRHVKGEPYRYIPKHYSVVVRRTQIGRFWSKVLITADDNQCWLWTGSCDTYGYGLFFWNGRNIVTSRIAWMQPNYAIPNKLHILHSCDNPACCNPKHLFIGTHQDNMADRVKKGRSRGKNSTK